MITRPAVMSILLLTPFAISFFHPSLTSGKRRLAFTAAPNLKPFIIIPFSKKENNDLELNQNNVKSEDFWAQQKQLAAALVEVNDKSLRASQKDEFSKRRTALVGDTVYIGFIMFCFLWSINANPFVAISYSFGTLMGAAYAFGLCKYVESVGGQIDDELSSRGAGVGQARFAFLIVLFIFVGKFRDQGLQEIPAIAGYFTYQLASLAQGFKEMKD